MSTTNIIIGLAIGMVLGGLIIALRNRRNDVFSGLLVVGIVGIAIAVTIVRVQQYRDQKAASATVAQAQPVDAIGTPTAPPAPPPVGFPRLAPLVRGPSGSAAPPVAVNPYAGNP